GRRYALSARDHRRDGRGIRPPRRSACAGTQGPGGDPRPRALRRPRRQPRAPAAGEGRPPVSPELLEPVLWAIGMALLAAVLFTGIGLISGTDETAIVAPLALLVILIGVPPAGVIAFFLAAIISKH